MRLHEGWPHAEIRWYDLAERRDMWLRLADELDEYRRDADHPDGYRRDRDSDQPDLLSEEESS